MNKLSSLRNEVRIAANPEQARVARRFFKTGKGEYGYGDIFVGIRVPVLRKIAKKYGYCDTKDIQILLRSKIHEERFVALVMLTEKMKDEKLQKNIFKIYLENTRFINNWDLVDVSAPRIVGRYLFDTSRVLLKKLARSSSLWERRIAIVSTLYFITHGEFADTLAIAALLLNDTHDLIHKATGWMLREVGKRSPSTLTTFLARYSNTMPRTMLRYAIEKFPPAVRAMYLRGVPKPQ